MQTVRRRRGHQGRPGNSQCVREVCGPRPSHCCRRPNRTGPFDRSSVSAAWSLPMRLRWEQSSNSACWTHALFAHTRDATFPIPCTVTGCLVRTRCGPSEGSYNFGIKEPIVRRPRASTDCSWRDHFSTSQFRNLVLPSFRMRLDRLP